MQPFYRPSLKEVRAAIVEINRISSRHADVHALHSIASCFIGYESLIQLGTWSRDLQRGYDQQLLRARLIDRTGVDTPAPFALAI